MLKSQQIQLAQSKRRERMAEIQKADEITDDARNELRSLTEAYQGAEIEFRAAVVLEDAERATIKTEDRAESDFERECRSFSLSALVGAVTDGRALAGREAEVSAELEKRNGSAQKGGILFPWAALETRADVVTTTAEDGDLTSRPVMQPLERLFEDSAAAKFGFRTVQVTGRPSWPEMIAGASAHWLPEGGCVDAEGIDTRTLTPTMHTAAARYLLTRQATKENPALETVLRRDLASVIREAVDRACFVGKGGVEPLGLLGKLQAAGRVGPLADPITFAALLGQAVDLMNTGKLSDAKDVRIATQPDALATLALDMVAGTAVSALDRVRNTLGPVVFSRQTADAGDRTVFFGAGDGLALVPTWGAPELIVDPYSESKCGKIALTIFTFVDVLVQRIPTHFYALHDAAEVTP